MHIDIEINFNDLVPPNQIGFVPKKKTYYEQLIILVKSIILNWDTDIHTYTVYIHHSRELADEKKKELESMGCVIVFNPSELQEYFNRENVLSHKTKGDYTLLLDTDILVLNTPILDDEFEICAKPAGNKGAIHHGDWQGIYKRLDIPMETPFVPHFNGGVWYIKNECKQPLYDLYLEHIDILRYFETKQRHFSMQYYYSLLVKKFNWGYINKRINVYSYESLDADILHYLGVRGYTQGVQKLISEIEDKYEAN